MKNILLLLSVITFASCSSIYKSGQTPDDLYAATPRPAVERTRSYERPDRIAEDRQIRMAAYDYRWRSLDDRYDYNYAYNPYLYGYNYGYYYNPYFFPYPVFGQTAFFVNPKNSAIRTTNLASYSNTISSYAPSKTSGSAKTFSVRGYNNSNSQTNERGRYDSRTYNDNRTYSPSSNSNNGGGRSSAPSSSGSSVPRPSRGGQ